MVEWGLQHLSGPADEWRCKWWEGEVKAFSDTKHTPGPWCRTLSLSTSRTQPLRLSIPLACITSASIYIFIQTNSWLLMLRWANDNRQTCPPPRIHTDKLLHHKVLKIPKKPQEWKKKKNSYFTWEWIWLENVLSLCWLRLGCKCQFHVTFFLYSSMTPVIASSFCMRMPWNEQVVHSGAQMSANEMHLKGPGSR